MLFGVGLVAHVVAIGVGVGSVVSMYRAGVRGSFMEGREKGMGRKGISLGKKEGVSMNQKRSVCASVEMEEAR